VKLLLTGDKHLRWKAPRFRVDDYFKTQLDKEKQILEIANNNNCEYILQPGDFFDSVDTPFIVIQHYINLYKEFNIPILCVRGQHDLRYHSSNIENTPLAVLEASGVVEVINNYKDFCDRGMKNPVFIYGCSWNEEVPKMIEGGNGSKVQGCHILLMHKMIIDEKLWKEQEDFIYVNHLFRKYGFDLFVTGDNHKSFIVESKGKFVVNCGSLMRSAINQIDHKPVVYIYDTDNKTIDKGILCVKNSEDIFNINEVEDQRERNKELDNFIEVLGSSDSEIISLNFVKNLLEELKKDDSIKYIIDELMEDIDYGRDRGKIKSRTDS